jgi:hypothetical protein
LIRHYSPYFSSFGANPYYHDIKGSIVTNNICREGRAGHNNSDNQVSNNISGDADGSDLHPTVPENWDDVFVGPDNGISLLSNFALKGSVGKDGGTDGTDIGIYGGSSGFSDSARPPGPRIVSKKVGSQTDADGNLRVEIKVSTQ